MSKLIFQGLEIVYNGGAALKLIRNGIQREEILNPNVADAVFVLTQEIIKFRSVVYDNTAEIQLRAELVRVGNELNELSNTNRTLAATAASLQSKLNDAHNTQKNLSIEMLAKDGECNELISKNTVLDNHIKILDAKIAEQDKLIDGFREMPLYQVQHGGTPALLVLSNLKSTQSELMDTMEKLAVSEQECEQWRNRSKLATDDYVSAKDSVASMTESCRLACAQRDEARKDRDEWVIRHSDVCTERDGARKGRDEMQERVKDRDQLLAAARAERDALHRGRLEATNRYETAERESARLLESCKQLERYVDKMDKAFESEDCRIWAQFAAAVSVDSRIASGLSYYDDIVCIADEMLRQYSKRFPKPCAA